MEWDKLQESLTAKGPPKSNAHKLCWQQVVDIRQRYAAGDATMPRLADQYNVNVATISRIVRYVYW